HGPGHLPGERRHPEGLGRHRDVQSEDRWRNEHHPPACHSRGGGRRHTRFSVHGGQSMTTDNSMLLVEDDDTFGRVITRAMQLRGYEVTHAASATQAEQCLADSHFDLAVLDLNLGGHSSLPLIPLLKEANPAMRI